MSDLAIAAVTGDGVTAITTSSMSFVDIAAAGAGAVSFAAEAGDKLLISYVGHADTVAAALQFSVNLGATTGDVLGTNPIQTITGDNSSRAIAVLWPHTVDAGDLVAGMQTVQMRLRSLTGTLASIRNSAIGIPVLTVLRLS